MKEVKRYPLTGISPRPDWWLVRPDEIEKIASGVTVGKYSVEARTPMGYPVCRVVYNDYPHTGNKVNWSSALCSRNPELFGRKEGQPQTVMLCGGIHGCEMEGPIILLNLISLLETGKDLRGKPRPSLVELASHYRLVLFPCVNMDGRAISPDHRHDADHEECRRAGGGIWKEGSATIVWPAMKEHFPLPLDKVEYPGGYPNSEGYNIQHDASPGNLKTAEAAALLKAAEEKCVDLFINMHSQPGSTQTTLLLQNAFSFPYNLKVSKDLVMACRRALTALDYPLDETLREPPYKFDINHLIALNSGATTGTIEFAARLAGSFDRTLETGYVYLETMFRYGLTTPFVDRSNLMLNK